MLYMFLDESGDLGFDLKKKGTSRYFLITIIVTKDREYLNKVIKKIIRSLSGKDRKKHSGVLHSYKENPKTRKKLLNLLCNDETLQVGVIYIDKTKIFKISKFKKHLIYNHMAEVLFGNIYKNTKMLISENINLIVSKRETNKLLNKNFNLDIKDKIISNHNLNIKIEIKNPLSDKGLQVVDMVSWSMFRKYEYKDTIYYDIVSQKVIAEDFIE